MQNIERSKNDNTSNPKIEKKPYTKPQLIRHGQVEQSTQQSNTPSQPPLHN